MLLVGMEHLLHRASASVRVLSDFLLQKKELLYGKKPGTAALF